MTLSFFLSKVIHPQNILRAECCHILTIFILIDIEYQQLKVEILYIPHQISDDIFNLSYFCLTFPVDQVNFVPFQIMLHYSYVLISTAFLDMIYFDAIFKMFLILIMMVQYKIFFNLIRAWGCDILYLFIYMMTVIIYISMITVLYRRVIHTSCK